MMNFNVIYEVMIQYCNFLFSVVEIGELRTEYFLY